LIPAHPRHPIENETDFVGTKRILPEQSGFARNKADWRGTIPKSVGFSDASPKIESRYQNRGNSV
jgi:hypothetical protein